MKNFKGMAAGKIWGFGEANIYTLKMLGCVVKWDPKPGLVWSQKVWILLANLILTARQKNYRCKYDIPKVGREGLEIIRHWLV